MAQLLVLALRSEMINTKREDEYRINNPLRRSLNESPIGSRRLHHCKNRFEVLP